jgi:regulator of protease activity HflC (stomatin/prohibitin superfamily)
MMRVTVSDWEAALLYRNGRYARELPSGSYRFWNPLETIEIKRLPRSSWLQAPSIDVLSKDRFPFRLSLSAFVIVTRPKEAFDGQYDATANVMLRTAAAQAAESFTLEDLMGNRAELAEKASECVGESIPGCKLDAMAVTSVVLPPEIRRLFSDVERAKKEGQAALERSRAEQASLRSLANAARLLKGNPELMNLRLLQSLTGPKAASLVLGANALAAITSADQPPAGGKPQ